MSIVASVRVKQHLIDPESCIRCNNREKTCPSGGITHSTKNHVVDVAKCTHCGACLDPCPTGATASWRAVPRALPYSVETQLGWAALQADEDSYFHVCGPKSMEEGVVLALGDISKEAGLRWEILGEGAGCAWKRIVRRARMRRPPEGKQMGVTEQRLSVLLRRLEHEAFQSFPKGVTA